MLFNSFAFLIFFPLVCLVYFLLPYKYRWVFLLGASYYFYMNWQPVYALLIFASTVITYLAGIKIEITSEKKRKKLYLLISLLINFGVLFLFKYYNFINGSIFAVLDAVGIRWPMPNFDLLLPVGISFYTFQAVGYSIDVYRGDLKAEKHFGIYALFVSFFPQLVAGPIERAKNLLGQFKVEHHFNYARAVLGLRQMLWGFFMKLCIADRVALYVNAAFNNVDNHNGTTLLLASVLFAFQIYCDFGGYSNIAIGAARIMGFDLMKNFERPYFATSVQDFWRRWHISLSTWFKDYVYIPLGGNRVGFSRHLFNLFITFLLSGMWHGANWTFFVWGSLHGFFLICGVLRKKYLPNIKLFSLFQLILNVSATFALIVFAWVFFRANNIEDAFEVIQKIITNQGSLFIDYKTLFYSMIGVIILFIKDFADEYSSTPCFLESRHIAIRWSSYLFLILLILLIGVFDGGQFIYFQF